MMKDEKCKLRRKMMKLLGNSWKKRQATQVLVLWRHMYVVSGPVVSNTFFGHDMWRHRTFYVSPEFYAKVIFWLCVLRLEVKKRENRNSKVNSFWKQCLHDHQLAQFGGILADVNWGWLERFGESTTKLSSLKITKNPVLKTNGL